MAARQELDATHGKAAVTEVLDQAEGCRCLAAELGIVEQDRNGKRHKCSISAGGDMNINIAASQPRWATNVSILVSKPGFSFHLISKTGFKYV